MTNENFDNNPATEKVENIMDRQPEPGIVPESVIAGATAPRDGIRSEAELVHDAETTPAEDRDQAEKNAYNEEIRAVVDPDNEHPESVHDRVPDDALRNENETTRTEYEAPREDGLNLKGYYRRAAGGDKPDGSTEIVCLDAAENARKQYEDKGYVFEGYVPNPPAPLGAGHQHREEDIIDEDAADKAGLPKSREDDDGPESRAVSASSVGTTGFRE